VKGGKGGAILYQKEEKKYPFFPPAWREEGVAPSLVEEGKVKILLFSSLRKKKGILFLTRRIKQAI